MRVFGSPSPLSLPPSSAVALLRRTGTEGGEGLWWAENFSVASLFRNDTGKNEIKCCNLLRKEWHVYTERDL